MDQSRICPRASNAKMKQRENRKSIADENQRSPSPWEDEENDTHPNSNQIVPDPAKVNEEKSAAAATTAMPFDDRDITSIHFGPILQKLRVQSTTIPSTTSFVPTTGLSIIGLDSVIIPRRSKEGTKRIFDRIELHESIRRRMELDKLHGTADGTLEEEPQINTQTTTVILPAAAVSPLEPQPSSSKQKFVKDHENSRRSVRSSSGSESQGFKTRKGRGVLKRKVKSRSPSPRPSRSPSSSRSSLREGESHEEYLIRERKWKRLERFGNARRGRGGGSRKFQQEDTVHRPSSVLHVDFACEGGLPHVGGAQSNVLHKVLFAHFAKLGPNSKLLSVKKYPQTPRSAWLIYDSVGDAMRAREDIQRLSMVDRVFRFFDVMKQEQFEIPYRVEYSNKVQFD